MKQDCSYFTYILSKLGIKSLHFEKYDKYKEKIGNCEVRAYLPNKNIKFGLKQKFELTGDIW